MTRQQMRKREVKETMRFMKEEHARLSERIAKLVARRDGLAIRLRKLAKEMEDA